MPHQPREGAEEHGGGGPTSSVRVEGHGHPDTADSEMLLENIEDVVSKCVIHSHRPFENMPSISPPELKIIGRCVTFRGDTTINNETRTMHYEGLVGTINKDTVMLVHVHRFTEEDYELHRLEQREDEPPADDLKKAPAGATATGEAMEAVAATGTVDGSAPAMAVVVDSSSGGGATTAPSGGTRRPPPREHDDGLTFDSGCVSPAVGPSGAVSPAPTGAAAAAAAAAAGETHGTTTARVRHRLAAGTAGPVPFMTFSRNRIHNVEFSKDPKSSFYSLFRDPSRHDFDMQCLRMFVRRFIVHTAQGNNPRNIPLRAFVTTRCNCRELDNDLLLSVAREELAHLVKAHRDMVRARKKTDRSRRNILRAYRAPPGLFRDTGILYLTRIPRQTLIVAALEMLVTAVIALVAAIGFNSAEPQVVAPYLNRAVPYVVACVVVSAMGAFFTGVHSIRMSIPLGRQLTLVVIRGILVVLSIAACLMIMIVLGESFTLPFVRQYIHSSSVRQDSLCMYYHTYSCSGFESSCFGTEEVDGTYENALCQCPFTNFNRSMFEEPCKIFIMSAIERLLIPLVCLALMLFLVFFSDLYLFCKMFHVAQLLSQRM